MNPNQTFKVGLIGAGYVSKFHLLGLRRLPQARLVGVCDLDRPRADTLAREAGCPAFNTPEQLFAAGVDAVHILTPPATHAALTIQALEHGCHVLVEKPLATNVNDCDRIAAAAQQADRTVGVNHSLLRDPFVMRALAAVRAGAVGDILTVDYFRSSDYPPYPGGPLPPQYRDGGYPFRDLGVHALYLLQEFLGDIRDVQAQFRDSEGTTNFSSSSSSLSVQSVSSVVSKPSFRKRDPNLLFDEWRALLRCARGTGQIQISWNVRPLQHQLFIQGTRGTLRVDLFSMFQASRRNTPLPKAIERAWNAVNEGRQISTQVPANVVRFLRKKILPYHGLQTLVADFYQALAAGQPAPVPIDRARPIVLWTEQVAQEADAAKTAYLQRFTGPFTAKVLVTGATGFIGRHLVRRLLAEGQRVRLFVRHEPTPELLAWLHPGLQASPVAPALELVLGDLGDPAAVDRAVAGTDLVYHVGAAMSGSREDFERGTVAGTRNILASLRRHRVSKLVYVSSLSVLHAAAARPGVKLTEAWPLEPRAQERGAYTQTKLAAEQLVRQATDLRKVILRPGQVFGPGAPLLTPAVARRVNGKLVILGDGQCVLPLVYVEDVVDAIRLAANRETGLFHLVDPATITQEQLARRVAGPQAAIVKVPLPLVRALAVGVELLGKLLHRSVPLTRYRLQSALAPIAFDCAAAEKELGWRPRVGVEEGLKQTLNP